MKILFDSQIFTAQKYGGISRYIYNLYHQINSNTSHQALLPVLLSQNYYAEHLNRTPFLEFYLGQKSSRAAKWNRRFTKFYINNMTYDIFHPSYYDPYYISFLEKPMVITVHDMIHEKFPSYFGDTEMITANKNKCTQFAQKIIAISESTKNDLVEFFEIDSAKITVVYHGIDLESKIEIDPIFKVTLPQKYLLFVGERGSYKNFAPFIITLSKILRENPQINLICAGGGKFSIAELEQIRQLDIQNQIVQINASDAQLNYLYQNALCFIFPSIYEGFGLPILEAFKNKCPIVVSNTSCFPEIVSDAGIFFNPYECDSLINPLQSLIQRDEIRQQLITNGQDRLSLFDLKKCIKNTLEVYKQILS